VWTIGGAAAIVATVVGVRAFAAPAGGPLPTCTGCLRKQPPIPAARVKATVPILTPDNTFTLIPLDQEEFDTAALHDPADNTKLTAPLAGIYTVSGHVSWPFNTQAIREVFLDANIGIVFQRVASSVLPAPSPVAEQSISTIVQLSAGDSVQLEVRTTGSNDNVQVSDHSPTLTMAWLGPSS